VNSQTLSFPTEIPIRKLWLVFLANFLIVGSSNSQYFPPPESQGSWRKNTSDEFLLSLGVDPVKLEEFGLWNVQDDFGGTSIGDKGCIVIKDGWIIGEWYADKDGRLQTVGSSINKLNWIASNNKSVAIMLFGSALKDREKLNIPEDLSLESKVYDKRWLPEGFPLSDPRKASITFDMVFRHTSGLKPESMGIERGGGRSSIAYTVGKHEEFKDASILFFDPGHPEQIMPKSPYSSVGYNHLTLFFRNLVGKPAWQYLEDKILNPIGITQHGYYTEVEQTYIPWLQDSIKWLASGTGGLSLTPREFTRYAYLLFNGGKWNDNQITPKGWVEQFRLTSHYPNLKRNKEGWWSRTGEIEGPGVHAVIDGYPDDAFMIGGAGMTWALMIPSENLIAIRSSRISGTPWDPVLSEFHRKLFNSFIDNNLKPADRKKRAQLIQGHALPGQIIIDPENPSELAYNRDLDQDGSLDPFFICGPGDREGFLFLGKRQEDGTIEGSMQDEIIDQLRQNGGNSMYLQAVRTHGGDAVDSADPDPEFENPFINGDPKLGLDEDILDQWEGWFSKMDEAGITIYFFFYDDGAKPYGFGNGTVNQDEKAFFEGIVNRFKHHKHLIWCIAEEYRESMTFEHASELAKIIDTADEHHHIIAVHHAPGDNLMDFRHDPNITQFAQQSNANSPQSLHSDVLEAVKDGAGSWNVLMAENWNGKNKDHYRSMELQDRKEIRLRNWSVAMAGASVMVIGTWTAATQNAAILKDMRILQEYMESIPDLNQMISRDFIGFDATDFVLGVPGKSYIAYSSEPNGKIGLRPLSSGKYYLKWLDCVTGKIVEQRNVQINQGSNRLQVPEEIANEVAVYLIREDQKIMFVKPE